MAHRHGTHSAPLLLPHVALTNARQNGVTDGSPMAAHVHLQCHSSILSPKQYHQEAEVSFLLPSSHYSSLSKVWVYMLERAA